MEKRKIGKDTFYICLLNEGKVTAVKKDGYTLGDVGLHRGKCPQGREIWIATHIPTGLRLMSEDREGKRTRQQVFKEAVKVLEENGQRVAEHMKTEIYETFRKSRYDQTVTRVF